MTDENTEPFVTKQQYAQLLRAQEQAFSILARALGAVVGEERLADALSGCLASLQATEGEAGDQLFAAAFLSRALQDLRGAHLPIPDDGKSNVE